MSRRGPARVLIADAFPLAGNALVALLAEQKDLLVLRSSAAPERIGAEIMDAQPDLLIVGLPNAARPLLSAVGAANSKSPMRILAITESRPGLDVSEFARAGVTSIVSRLAPPAEVVDAIRQTLVGSARVTGEIAKKLMEELAIAARLADIKYSAVGLSGRELEVLQLVADGMSNRDVATSLHISENTVKNHMRSVHEKLGVKSRTEAVVTAAREGIVRLK